MADTRTSSLLRYMGLIGTSGARTGSMVPRAQTPDADQRLWQEFQDAGRVSDPEIWTKFNSMLKRPTTFDAMLQLWDEMSQWDLLAAALVEIVDEATQTDANSPGAIWYQCNDSKFEEELNDMLVRLDVESTIQSQVWYIAAMGNHFEKLEYAPHEGVIGMSFVHPMEMRRYWLERNRKCIGFRWMNHKPNKEDIFVQPDNRTPVERVSMASGQNTEELWYPWDFCFSGDTKISLLDGREVSLEQLQKEVGTSEFWVYSVTPDGRIVPGRAHSLKRTRQAAEIVEVEIDNGEKIKCTPDHKFMLRDGMYREANQLQPGDSLMPLYRKLSTVEEHDRAGYELFFDNSAKRWRFTHWRVAETVYGTRRNKNGRFSAGYHVHHADFNKRDNAPKNLKWLTVAEHNKIHTDLNTSPEHKALCRKARSEAMKRTWKLHREKLIAGIKRRAATPEGQAVLRTNAERLHARRASDQAFDLKFREAVRKNGEKLRDYCAATGLNSQPHRKAASREVAVKLNQRLLTDPALALKTRNAQTQNMQRLNERIASGEVQRKSPVERVSSGELRRDADGKYFNHKVVSVKNAGSADVYDFEVDGQHNFALSAGVFVHNCHFRRMFRMRVSEHGEPIFAEADGIYKKLRLAVDQMVVCRAQVQPDRYAVSIDVQEQPPMEQMKTVQRWRQTLRSKLAFGQVGAPNELNSAGDFTAYYNALALDTMIYIAQPKGFNNVITKLPGTADVPDVYDIELLTDLFYSIIGMPKSWFSGGQSGGGGETPSGRALLAQDIRFLRKIKSIRKPLISTYQWLGYFHAVLKGKDVKELDIKAMMPQIGSLEEQLKLEMLGAQADVLSKLGDVMDQYSLPKEAWIDTVFKRYMHLPDEVVSVFMTALPDEIEQSGSKDESKKGAPSTRKLIEEITKKLESTPGGVDAIKLLKEVVYKEKLLTRPYQKWTRERVLGGPSLKENDVVISSFGRHPFEFKRTNLSESKAVEGAATGVLQAKLDELPKKWDDDGGPASKPAPIAESTDPTQAGVGQPTPYRRWMGK